MFGADPSLKQLPVVSLALVPQKYRDTTESDPNRSVECVVFLARIAWFFVLVSSTSVRSKGWSANDILTCFLLMIHTVSRWGVRTEADDTTTRTLECQRDTHTFY
jgi:hypothetical protein